MGADIKRSQKHAGLIALAGLLIGGAVARADIINIQARIATEVQELVGDEPVALDSAVELFPTTSDTLPIQVTAGLGEPESGGVIGAGVAVLRDPTLVVDSPNPGELGIEATCASADPSVRYEATSTAVETRKIAFSPTDLDTLFKQALPVNSVFFLSGAMVIWADEPGQDLTGVDTEVIVRVTRRAASDAGDVSSGQTLLEAHLRMVGVSDGKVQVRRSGAIRYALDGTSSLLADQESMSDSSDPQLVTQSVDVALANFGAFHLLVVPMQALPYSYAGQVGRSFVLEATIEVRASNVPGGTGAAAAFGMPFSQLAAALNISLDAYDAAEAIQAAVNAVEMADDGGAPAVIHTSRGAGACGAFGVEAAAMLVLAAVPLPAVARRARTRRRARQVDPRGADRV